MTLSRKIIVRKPTLQTTNKFFFLDNLSATMYFKAMSFLFLIWSIHPSFSCVRILLEVEYEILWFVILSFLVVFLFSSKFSFQLFHITSPFWRFSSCLNFKCQFSYDRSLHFTSLILFPKPQHNTSVGLTWRTARL